jgi:ribonuclease HII
VTSAKAPKARGKVPTLREERRLLRSGHQFVAGMDEVGRGALAGPVSVGVVVIDVAVGTAPSGVRDSKLLTPAAREALVPRLRRWAVAYAVGHAEPAEIDRYGIVPALRLAGRRALAALPVTPSCVLLDGSHDWLSVRPAARAVPEVVTEPLFDLDVAPGATQPEIQLDRLPEVHTLVKADLRCAAVAAASVLAKVERDAIMVSRSAEHPRYAWQDNKGYSAPEHVAALVEHGPCEQHRRSWSLPGVASDAIPDPALLGGDLFAALEPGDGLEGVQLAGPLDDVLDGGRSGGVCEIRAYQEIPG